MNIKNLLFVLFFLPVSCTTNKESDFEKMLAEFSECKFENLYVDFKTHEPQNQYFIDRKMTPYKVENGAAYFNINERIYGLPVSQIIISAGYSIVAVVFDAPLDVVEKQIQSHLKHGYNKEPAPVGSNVTLLTPMLDKHISNPQQTILSCDFEPNY